VVWIAIVLLVAFAGFAAYVLTKEPERQEKIKAVDQALQDNFAPTQAALKEKAAANNQQAAGSASTSAEGKSSEPAKVPAQVVTAPAQSETNEQARAEVLASKVRDFRGAFNKIADKAAPDLRRFAKTFALPPEPDKKVIEERKAQALELQKDVNEVRAGLQELDKRMQETIAQRGLSASDASYVLKQVNQVFDLPRRTIATDEIHEMSVLAIRECDTLLANLGSWKLEGGSIVGKDADHTTQLNDARFFLKAKLNQLETRIVQLRGE
jgi:hypothetical protein